MIDAERLRALRLKRGLSQDKLGALIGYDGPYIFKVEHRQVRELRSTTLLRLADALDCSVDYLLGRTKKDTLAIVG